MTYSVNTVSRIAGPGLRKPGTARQLAAGSSSANTALTTTCERISILAVTADIRYLIGTSAQTANAGTSHFIKTGERLELDVPLGANIGIIRDASTDGVLELTEFSNY
tara:strand:- start:409 stop:732 length:324 start_codon:yes stop_codon:yes gene_type:complete